MDAAWIPSPAVVSAPALVDKTPSSTAYPRPIHPASAPPLSQHRPRSLPRSFALGSVWSGIEINYPPPLVWLGLASFGLVLTTPTPAPRGTPTLQDESVALVADLVRVVEALKHLGGGEE